MNSGNPLNRLEAVNRRLYGLGVREPDLAEEFIRSGGRGGQNVNKVATAVRLSYRDIEVKCMEERSQAQNRIRAREILADRLEQTREKSIQFSRAEALRLRKKKAGRPWSIKRQILKDKRINSRLKKNRSFTQGRDE